MAERIIAQVSQLVLFVAAARILSPADFGVFALVSSAAILLMRSAEVGWAPYIMSWEGDDTVPRQVVMVALISGVCIGALAFGVGLLLPLIGLPAVVSHLFLLFSVWIALATTSSAQRGMMIWRDGLLGSSIAESLGEIAGMLVALVLLFHGYGVYSLAFGRLAYQTVHIVLSFAVTRRSPLWGMPRAELRALGHYSWQIFTSRFITNMRLYIGTFLIGGFLGPASVGYYRAAQRLVGSVAEIIGSPSLVLSWSMFRQARDRFGARSPGFQTQVNVYFKLLTAAGLPIFLWLGLMGGDLITGLIGAKWLPALPLVPVLAFARALTMPNTVLEPILSLTGEIRRLPGFTLIFFIVAAVSTVAGGMIGLTAVAWSEVLTSALAMVAGGVLLQRHCGIAWDEVFAALRSLVLPLLAGSLALLFFRETLGTAQIGPLTRVLIATLPSLVIYALALALFDPDLRLFLRRRLRARANA
ncbi:MAG: oligosaccharide flippase family protein [Paracoccaceae bacterium]|nr:oligosaccharide flippase family protein [Paracoccaceae bacterium]